MGQIFQDNLRWFIHLLYQAYWVWCKKYLFWINLHVRVTVESNILSPITGFPEKCFLNVVCNNLVDTLYLFISQNVTSRAHKICLDTGVVSEATFFYQKHFTNYITHVGVWDDSCIPITNNRILIFCWLAIFLFLL